MADLRHLSITGREFTVQIETTWMYSTTCFLLPADPPAPEVTAPAPSENPLDCDTMIRFKLVAFPGMPLKGLITHISVEPAQQRSGLGTAMCLALAETYPGRIWDVECPNDASSALFTKLHLAQPDRFVEQGLVHPF